MDKETYVSQLKAALEPITAAIKALSKEERKILVRDLAEWQPGKDLVDGRIRAISNAIFDIADHSE